MCTYESLENYQEILTFTIPGRPATKKTSQRVVRIGRMTKFYLLLLMKNTRRIVESIVKTSGKMLEMNLLIVELEFIIRSI